ncbi:hypothetical protein DFJ77DRAFT_171155 [Powellomyces hirtus]|nr:hypothetical protein DFJ77DRAFT_171155 [Powellomyces hirtus]
MVLLLYNYRVLLEGYCFANLVPPAYRSALKQTRRKEDRRGRRNSTQRNANPTPTAFVDRREMDSHRDNHHNHPKDRSSHRHSSSSSLRSHHRSTSRSKDSLSPHRRSSHSHSHFHSRSHKSRSREESPVRSSRSRPSRRPSSRSRSRSRSKSPYSSYHGRAPPLFTFHPILWRIIFFSSVLFAIDWCLV